MTTDTRTHFTIAIAETLRDCREIPAGHLYAALMGVLSLQDFEFIIARLVTVGLVRRESSHMLTWMGETPAQAVQS